MHTTMYVIHSFIYVLYTYERQKIRASVPTVMENEKDFYNASLATMMPRGFGGGLGHAMGLSQPKPPPLSLPSCSHSDITWRCCPYLAMAETIVRTSSDREAMAWLAIM